jgi:hypothetical protein
MTTSRRVDIEEAIEVLSQVFGSRENVLITILEILQSDGDITEEQRLEILRGILAYQNPQQEQEEEQEGVLSLYEEDELGV